MNTTAASSARSCFELLGTDEDVRILRAGLLDNAEKLGLNRNPHDDAAGDAGVDTRG